MNRLISHKEYKKIYPELNHPILMTLYTKKGALIAYCNGRLVMLKQEMADFKQKEVEIGEKFNYSVQFIPASNIHMIKRPDGYMMCAKNEISKYIGH